VNGIEHICIGMSSKQSGIPDANTLRSILTYGLRLYIDEASASSSSTFLNALSEYVPSMAGGSDAQMSDKDIEELENLEVQDFASPQPSPRVAK